MKKLICLILAIVMLFSLCACGTATAPNPTSTPVPTESASPEPGSDAFAPESAAVEAAKLLCAGDYDGVAATFDANMAQQADAAYIGQLWSGVTAGLGDFVAVDESLTVSGEYDVYTWATAFCEFTGGGVGAIQMFDAEGKMASLMFNYYNPASQLTFDSVTEAKPMLWEVTSDKGGKLYLFGSFHMANDSLYALPDAVMSAYEGSDALALEYDVVGALFDVPMLMEQQTMSMYLDGTTAADHLSPETYDAAVSYLTEAGMYSPQMDYFCVANWSSMISLAMASELGFDASAGVDNYLGSLAKAQGKPVYEVESQSFQLALLNSLSDEYQDFAVSNMLENLDEGRALLSDMAKAYYAGDEAAMTKLIEDEEFDESDFAGLTAQQREALVAEDEAYHQKMYGERNTAMTAVAEEYLASGETVFFVVGEAHMLGEDGIVAQLTNAGFTVTRVEY